MTPNAAYELFYNLSTDLMCITGEDGYFKQLNPAWTSTLGWTKDELLSEPLASFLHPDDVETTSRQVAKQLNGETTEAFVNRYRCKDGSYRWLEWKTTPASDGTLFANASDITERIKSEKKISQLAYIDAQTGMPNEVSFNAHLSETLSQNHYGFVASIALAGLGDIIGTFGLEATELIFYEVGERLSKQMNEKSLAARVSKHSFKVTYISSDNGRTALKGIASKIFHVLQDPFDLMGAEVFVNVHMGVKNIDVKTSTAEGMLTDAEITLYEAKKSASSSLIFFQSSIKEHLVRNTLIVSWLHTAIENNVFQLFFQPQVNLKTNKVVGCEALIRWPNSTDTWISPAEFIPIAEKAGLIGDITRWTVAEGFRTATGWAEEHGVNIRVGVNISAEELASHDFLDYVSKYLEETKMLPESLEIEITETALMKDPDVASRNLVLLRNMGASVAIDDFGTGQASLAYLKQFPIDRLKIDQSFVKGALQNNTDREIIVSVVSLAHSIGMDVIAEGAEEKEHMELLMSLGCDEVQGYYIARPMPADQFVEFVSEYSK